MMLIVTMVTAVDLCCVVNCCLGNCCWLFDVILLTVTVITAVA